MNDFPQPWSGAWLAAASRAELVPADSELAIRRVVTDSRLVGPGDLFVALTGERFDGHQFLAEVAQRGAAAVMVNRPHRGAIPRPLPGFVVADTRQSYGWVAGAHRENFHLPVVCVGGSNGKTTTKEIVASLLGTRFRTLKSEASFNNEVGVPATLLRLDEHHGAAVLEAGTNHPGELAPLVRLIAPQLGIITSFGREHLEYFRDLAGVVQEEGMLAEGLPAGGTLVLDGDSPFSASVAARVRPGVRVLRVGLGTECDWRAQGLSMDWEGISFRVTSVPHPAWSGVWRLSLPGEHTVRNALSALAVAAELGVPPAAARPALAGFSGAPQRLELSRVGGLNLIDDTYNANADSMLAALRTLTDLPCSGRRVAVLGDMGELGPMTETAHGEVGQASAQAADALFAIGNWAEVTAKAARAGGLARVESYATVDQGLLALRGFLRAGDTVLVKASRAARLEQVVADLRQQFARPNPEAPQRVAAEPCFTN